MRIVRAILFIIIRYAMGVSPIATLNSEYVMRTAFALLMSVFLVLPILAQDRPDPQNPDGEEGATPPSWEVRLDKPSDDVVIGADKETADIWFVNMTPGWHITTGPAAILYHPANTDSGAYSVTAKIYLFDPGERREAYGVFFGGQGLDGEDIQYDYFLLRNTGEFLIKRRTGAGTSLIQDWTAHEAIQIYGPDSESSVENNLRVDVMAEEVAFSVNGAEVARMPRADLLTDGIAGLRINHALNVHVAEIAVTAAEE